MTLIVLDPLPRLDRAHAPSTPTHSNGTPTPTASLTVAEQIELEDHRHAHAERMARISRNGHVMLALISGPITTTARLACFVVPMIFAHLLNVPDVAHEWIHAWSSSR